jgi:hypothetical protein
MYEGLEKQNSYMTHLVSNVMLSTSKYSVVHSLQNAQLCNVCICSNIVCQFYVWSFKQVLFNLTINLGRILIQFCTVLGEDLNGWYRNPVDKHSWKTHGGAAVVNAFYSSSGNS